MGIKDKMKELLQFFFASKFWPLAPKMGGGRLFSLGQLLKKI
jgi:hypothetical protein